MDGDFSWDGDVMLQALIFNDTYRPIACSLISAFMVYFMRNDKGKIRIVFYSVYLIYITGFFALLFGIGSLANNSINTQALFWGLKWVIFFVGITVAQHFVYKTWGQGKDRILFIINVAVVLILCRVAMYLIDKT